MIYGQGRDQFAKAEHGESDVKTLVVSGVGMKEGGILTVLRDFVSAAERLLPADWRIVVLAHRKELLTCERAEVFEYPSVKASWAKRMWFELVTSRRLARELRATVWFAMHDITPIVDVERQYVYCHNPTPFAKPTLRALYFDWIFCVHSLLYARIYSLNLKRNSAVFVQQSWIRDQFMQRFGAANVVVSRPAPKQVAGSVPAHAAGIRSKNELLKWVYPTFPRHFKNIEVIGFALEVLEREADWEGEVTVTIEGDENRYSKWIRKRFGHLRSLRLIGRQSPEQMKALYAGADGLLFPSKLETWGLPISEAQALRLPLLIADVQYAHETVGRYERVSFFDPEKPAALAEILRNLSRGETELGTAVAAEIFEETTVIGWDNLVREVCN